MKSVRKMQKKSDKILSVREQILEQMKQKSKNGFIWSELLLDNFKRNDIDVALHTFAKKEIIKKIINGLYYIKPHKKPSMEDIANAIMLKNGFNGVTTNDSTIYIAAIPKTLKYNVCGQILTFKAISSKKINLLKEQKDNIHYLYKHNSPKGDEQYTPKEGVTIIVPFLKEKNFKTVWCPFDTEDSWYVKLLKEQGFNVIYSHISTGQDFFTYTPSEPYDCIVSNPPFSKKQRVIQRLIELDKPFAMLLPMTWLNDKNCTEAFKNKQMQLLIPYKRINFDNSSNTKVPFKSAYFCCDVLPRDIVNCNS